MTIREEIAPLTENRSIAIEGLQNHDDPPAGGSCDEGELPPNG
jgi:hypothetical protein